MSCLLCLSDLVGDDPSKSVGNNNAAPRRIRISTLCKLLWASCSLNNSTTYHQTVTSQLEEDDETCDLCPCCGPVISQVEEIRGQICLLEGQIRTKFTQIRATISSSVQNEGQDKISKIRDIILRVTDEIDDQRTNDNFASNEIEVKVEFDDDTVPDADEELLNDYHHPYDCTNFEVDSDEENEIKVDPLQLDDDDDDDSEFCIIPCSQKRKKSAQPKSQRNLPIKRKLEIKKPDKSTPPIKRVKRESRPSLQKTRSSPRCTKPQNQPEPLPKRAITKKKVPSIPPFQSKPESTNSSNDSDWAPKSGPENSDDNSESDTEVEKVAPSKQRRSHKCTSCAKAYFTESALTLHMSRDHSYPCPACPAKLSRSRALVAHVKRLHPGVAAFRCSICKKKLKSKNVLAAHMVARHEKGEKKFPCVKCGKSFCLVENLERHLALHEVEGVKPVVCDICDTRFENDERMKKHRESHNFKFTCDYCGLGGSNRVAMDRHIRIHTGEKPEKCDQCEASFIDKAALGNHIAKEHSSTKEHVCHICGKDFHLSSSLKTHLEMIHEGRKKCECETCGEKFRGYNNLQSHRVRVHGADPLVCDECGATFLCKSGLRQHKERHEGIKRHTCEICEISFTTKYELDSHRRVHTNERPYPCPHCEKAFKQSKHLRTHVLRLHTPGYVAPIRFPCPHCDKGYPHNHFLQAHIRQVHTGERPFVCDQVGCGKGFAKKTSLYLHLKGHHGLVMEKKKSDRLPRGKRMEEVPHK